MNRKAFSVLELLVVVAIIGALAAVILVNTSNARSRARDASRTSSITEIQSALDLYYEANNTFIVSTGGCNTVPNNLWCNSIQGPNQARWIRNNNSTQTLAHYLANDPNDPAPLSSISPAGGLFVWSPEGGGAFYYFGTPDFYMLVFQLENASHPIKAKNGVVPDADRGGTVRVNGVCMYDYSRYVGDDRVVIVGKNNSKNSCN